MIVKQIKNEIIAIVPGLNKEDALIQAQLISYAKSNNLDLLSILNKANLGASNGC